MTEKRRLLIISSVLPFPRTSGQQQRIYYTLHALRERFHLTFLTVAPQEEVEPVGQKLLSLCDDAIVLPSIYSRTTITRLFHRLVGSLYVLWTGLKFSNYLAGEVELSARRIRNAIKNQTFDLVLFEYWHAHKAAAWFRARNVSCLLDMHDILWRSYARQLEARKYLPQWIKRWMVRRYQVREEAAWNDYGMLIAINSEELEYARLHTQPGIEFFHVPMGTDLSAWPYCWEPAHTRCQVAYYGGLGSPHNQQDAMRCACEIMPLIWQKFPDIELWIVGSNPPSFIKKLELDPRIHVTGFVEHPQAVLKSMSLVLCPWTGTYGFRSRVVEVMALGVPVVASRDAVYGMDLKEGQGIALSDGSAGMANQALRWLSDASLRSDQSRLARQTVEERFGYEATYSNFALELCNFVGSLR